MQLRAGERESCSWGVKRTVALFPVAACLVSKRKRVAPKCGKDGSRVPESSRRSGDRKWDKLRADCLRAHRYGLHEGVIVKVTALSAGPDPFLEQEGAAEEPAEEPRAEAAPAQETTQPAAASGAVVSPLF